jgi:hypothetical protein
MLWLVKRDGRWEAMPPLRACVRRLLPLSPKTLREPTTYHSISQCRYESTSTYFGC